MTEHGEQRPSRVVTLTGYIRSEDEELSPAITIISGSLVRPVGPRRARYPTSSIFLTLTVRIRSCATSAVAAPASAEKSPIRREHSSLIVFTVSWLCLLASHAPTNEN